MQEDKQQKMLELFVEFRDEQLNHQQATGAVNPLDAETKGNTDNYDIFSTTTCSGF